ncbi:hypothetical protein ANN_17948 [Periplaneta americana]|uniref:Uncharacterized protein n=1 Tax=Periplaneta americana TaxID=6978 RepID=A0ABQ8SNV4_PERAM|nr:hypothetical protein ANN_17948 [Periplaneta americana]
MAGLCEGGNEPTGSLKAIYTSFHLQFHQVRQIVPPFWFSRLDHVQFKIIGPTPVIKFDHHQLACLTLIEIDTPQIGVEDGQVPT